jgi:rubrerythrin
VSSDPDGGTERSHGAERPDGGMRRWGGGMTWRADPEDQAGDPVCWLPRVCQACGALADEDPPTTCPRCGSEIPGA